MERSLQQEMFARSLLLQSSWSYEGQQNLGFLFAMDPALKRLYTESSDYREAAARHLEYFNTHPYMSGLVLGAVAGMEELRAETPADQRAALDGRIRTVKRGMAASLAAIGDAFFWGALRPACAAVVLLVWLLLASFKIPGAGLWALTFYLVAFNVPALWARWRGLALGYQLRENLAPELAKLRWQSWSRRVRRAGLVAAAMITAAALIVPPWGAGGLRGFLMLAAAVALRVYGLASLKTYAAAIVIGAAGALVGAW
jgi:PTS system mannose-specific IID component